MRDWENIYPDLIMSNTHQIIIKGEFYKKNKSDNIRKFKSFFT